MQSMYELVGDKIREIFDAQVVDIGIYDFENEIDPLPVHDRDAASGCPTIRCRSARMHRWFIEHQKTNRAPVVIDDVEEWVKQTGLQFSDQSASRRSRSSSRR